eukprot:scaffold136708_cov124-Phaeocystis_antarctica.AAC.2
MTTIGADTAGCCGHSCHSTMYVCCGLAPTLPLMALVLKPSSCAWLAPPMPVRLTLVASVPAVSSTAQGCRSTTPRIRATSTANGSLIVSSFPSRS